MRTEERRRSDECEQDRSEFCLSSSCPPFSCQFLLCPFGRSDGLRVNTYPKRLIEVDLPIARISAHARREKSIRHGHISTLHIWWARRPLAACRAVICAALWPDPADENCPQAFRDAAARHIMAFARRADGDLKLLATSSEESKARWAALSKQNDRKMTGQEDTPAPHLPVPDLPVLTLRAALLDFIADFANWDNSTNPPYLATSRALTQAAHEALGGEPGTRPLVVDPFAGGGSIPLEALRIGADAFASDLNPVAVLLNKIVLEYIPKYGQRLADEVRKWGEWIKKEAEKELAELYPKDPDGAVPIAYLWARTIQCEGPGCGAEVPLIRSLWLAKRANRSIALQLRPNPNEKRVDFRIIVKNREGWSDQAGMISPITNPSFDGTVRRGSATCPCCGYTTPVARVREQLKKRSGGATDARLMCVISSRTSEKGRFYRLPIKGDERAVVAAVSYLEKMKQSHTGPLSLVPDEKLDLRGIRHTWAMIYGLENWNAFFTIRQSVSLTALTRLVLRVRAQPGQATDDPFATAVQSCLALVVSREVDKLSSIARWDTTRENPQGTFARQALPMLWDFNEVNPLSGSGGDWDTALDWVCRVCESQVVVACPGSVEIASASQHPLPSDSGEMLFTDPPYYDAVPYAYLSDYFYVWLRRALADAMPDLFRKQLVPKDEEIVVDRPHELSNSTHDIAFYERELMKAFSEGRRIVRPDGVGVIVFASKTTASWEAILKAVVDAGWIITGSWPIDTEMENRVSAQGQARLASSVHLVCRPRENVDGTVIESVGEWRDVLGELPARIHEWMPRLAEEGVVGADAIFACLGPALEIFSRYSRVEKASGEAATLREYLEYVWAAVSTEALSLIFADADAAGLEPDARLTAMWLWTLGGGSESAGANGNGHAAESDEEVEDADDEDSEEGRGKGAKVAGYVLEFDAARKIAQGLGIHLEKSESIVEVKGDKARLRPVSERTQHLFGKDTEAAPTGRGKKKGKQKQKSFFEELDEAQIAEAGWGELKGPPPGSTVLDRLHQSMILFAAGRGELLKRFLTEDGVGSDARFWKLAQSFSALYPRGSDEKRWVDGVLARKKGLGL
jgi:putative DNA methylase